MNALFCVLLVLIVFAFKRKCEADNFDHVVEQRVAHFSVFMLSSCKTVALLIEQRELCDY